MSPRKQPSAAISGGSLSPIQSTSGLASNKPTVQAPVDTQKGNEHGTSEDSDSSDSSDSSNVRDIHHIIHTVSQC